MTDDIVRCPHCGTDFTPSRLSAAIEIARMRAQWTESIVQFNHLQNAYDVLMARSKDKDAEVEQLRREVRRGENTYAEGYAAGFKKAKPELDCEP
jgi:hypothetical protein